MAGGNGLFSRRNRETRGCAVGIGCDASSIRTVFESVHKANQAGPGLHHIGWNGGITLGVSVLPGAAVCVGVAQVLHLGSFWAGREIDTAIFCIQSSGFQSRKLGVDLGDAHLRQLTR